MSHEELIDFVSNENFLKNNSFFNKEKYTELYEEIKKEEQIWYKKNNESFDAIVKIKIEKILEFFKTIDYSGDINTNDIKFKKKDKYNNIIYFDENTDKKYQESIYSNC